jgi:hypothetical protein
VSELIGLKVADVADGHLTVQRLGGKRNMYALMASPDPVFDEATLLPSWHGYRKKRMVGEARAKLCSRRSEDKKSLGRADYFSAIYPALNTVYC